MYISLGTFLLCWLAYAWFSQPPRPHFDCGGPCCARRNGRDDGLPAAPAQPVPARGAGVRCPQYLWLPLGLVAFVVLSLLAHALLPR